MILANSSMKYLSVGLAALFGLSHAATNCTECTATCNTDQTVDITIPYHRVAMILSLSYGSCDITSDDVRVEQDDDTFEFTVKLDAAKCDMDGKLRTLEYDSTVADIRVGANSTGIELEFSRFQFNTWCSFNDTYQISFDYGTLSTDDQFFNETGGEIGYAFIIEACTNSTCEEYSTDFETKGGEQIHLGLHCTSSHFDYTTKKFAPTGCMVKDVNNTLEYTLFGTADAEACTNDDVEFAIAYSNMVWMFEHVLFLLGNYESSTFQLTCTVIVCDYDQTDSKCNKIATACGTSY